MCNYLTAHRHDDTNKTKNDGLQNENVLHTGPKIVHNIKNYRKLYVFGPKIMIEKMKKNKRMKKK